MCTSIYLSLDFFSTMFLQRDARDIKYADSVSPKLSYLIIGVFSQHNMIMPYIFLTVFLRTIHDN
jgi:hypothetical protein